MRAIGLRFLQLFVLGLLCGSALGFINPKFTPVDLVKQSDVIVTLEFKGVEEKTVKEGGQEVKEAWATATVTKVVKGEFKDKEIKIDLLAAGPDMAADGQAVIERIRAGAKQAMMFMGKFDPGEHEGDVGGGGPGKMPEGYVHLGGRWFGVNRDKGDWDMDKSDDKMLGTWSGGTDMLVRVVEYVLADPQAVLPVQEGIQWVQEDENKCGLKVGVVPGKIYQAAPVDLAGNGKTAAFLAADSGDHLYRWNADANKFEDIAAVSGLTSKSQAFAWGDFLKTGRVGLASWDGQALTIFSQDKDGKFTGKVVKVGDALKDGCISLTAVDAGAGKPALLVSTKASPVLLTIQADGSAQAKPLVSGEFPGKNFGDAGECLVADFDNDGLPDVMQMCSGGALFYRGTKPGEFAPPVKTAIGTDMGRHGVCVGDWDADGLLDIFTCAENRNHLWHNLGGGKFVDVIDLSGSVAYISKPGGIFVQTCDINSTGRQGLLMLYGAQLSPNLFFNRGFRSFGEARRLEEQMKKVANMGNAQQAGCMGDFVGNGAPGCMLALDDGAVWFFTRKVEDRALGVTVALSTASPNAGPVTVWASGVTEVVKDGAKVKFNRDFGAAAIRVGEPGAFYGVPEAGPVLVKWRFPGGPVQEKEVTIKNNGIRLVIDKVAPKAGENK